MGVGIQQGGKPVGEPGAIPVPGSTILSDSVQPGELRSSSSPGTDLGTIGSADLANKPDIIQQLFPNLLDQLLRGRSESAGVESRKPDGSSKLRNRSTSDSKPVRPKPGRDAGQRRRMGPKGQLIA